ncbi:Uncharacterised protein [Acinetobacter baumannii]|nr:Uncharacterised protein [Acinetobacter baumannii]
MDDGQPQPAAAGGAIAAGVEANERLEHPLTLFRRDTRPVIFDLQTGEIAVEPQPNAQALFGIAQRVVDQVIEHALHQAQIDAAEVADVRDVELDVAFLMDKADIIDFVLQPLWQIDGFNV